MDVTKLKMYILIKESVDLGHAILGAAHASLSGYLAFQNAEGAVGSNMRLWVHESFRKVVCRVTDEEFERAKEYPDHRVMTESGLDNMEVAIVFAPREEWPKFFKFLRLYK